MKKVKIIMLLIIILSFTYVNVYAFNIGEVFSGAKGFLSGGETQTTGIGVEGKISETIKGLATAGLAIGTIVAICAGIVIAIQAMANGAYGKAQLKELLTPYIIACVVLFAAWTIWAGVVKMMEDVFM